MSYSASTGLDDFVEKQNLIGNYDLEGGNFKASGSTQKGPLARLSSSIDERTSVKKLKHVWGPRLELVVRIMLVATFFDDSLRTIMNFGQHVQQVGGGEGSPAFNIMMAGIFLAFGVSAQLFGSVCLLLNRYPDAATKALMGWIIIQPVLYGQLTNVEFITESISLAGGILLLRAHLVFDQASNAKGARTQLYGRLLLPAMYLYYAWLFIFWDFSEEETNSYMAYFASLSKSVFDTIIILSIVFGSVLLFFGLRSRVVSLLLALVNLAFVTYLHPFFLYISRKDGQWVYDEVNMPSASAVVSSNIAPEEIVYDPAQVYDMHRYYFFLGLSTSGALFLLALFGPGEIAVQKSEVLLPVVRGRD